MSDIKNSSNLTYNLYDSLLANHDDIIKSIYPIKLQLPLFDLKYDKIRENIKHYIELHENHLLWVIECWLDKYPKPDDDLGIIRENEYCNEIDFIPKNKIISIESYFATESELWVLLVCFGNREEDCKFETEAELREVEKKLYDWYNN